MGLIYGKQFLIKKTKLIILACFGLLSASRVIAKTSVPILNSKNENSYSKKMDRGNTKQLILRTSKYNETNYILVSHRSHRSHSSHRSHYSSSSGNSGGSKKNDGIGVGGLLLAGAIAYGAYQVGKNKRK